MNLRRGNVLRLLFVVPVFFAMVTALSAHAVLLESSPALKGTVTGPDVAIKLRFNVRIDRGRSRLSLIEPGEKLQTLEIGKQSAADTLVSNASGLAAGEYRIRWQVLASDGHITRGEIPFTVKHS